MRATRGDSIETSQPSAQPSAVRAAQVQAKGKGKQKQQHAHSGAIREIPATAALALQREHARITCFPYTSVQKSLHKNVMTAKSFSNTALTQARQDIRDGIRLRKQGDQTTGETLSANLANERGERGERGHARVQNQAKRQRKGRRRET